MKYRSEEYTDNLYYILGPGSFHVKFFVVSLGCIRLALFRIGSIERALRFNSGKTILAHAPALVEMIDYSQSNLR